MGSTKTLHAGLSENNARCIVAELNRLDKKENLSIDMNR